MRRILFLLVGLLLLVSLGCAQKQAQEPKAQQEKKAEKVTVMLDWVPNTNHSGLYVAKDKGYFREQGLDVEIVQPSQGGTSQLVATGKAQFGVSYQEDVTLARASGVPVVSIAAVIQHNTSGFASKKELNIKRPKDLEGKRYGGWGSPTEDAVLAAVLAQDQGDAKKIKNSNIGTTDVFTAIQRDIDFAWIYYGWDGVEAERRNIGLDFMPLKDLHPALDYYTPVLITSEKIIADNPELAKKFMAAVSRGYRDCIENPREAAEILVKNAPETNKELALISQEWLAAQFRADAPRWGEQKKEVWQRYNDWMYQQKLLPQPVEVEKAFTNEFLPR